MTLSTCGLHWTFGAESQTPASGELDPLALEFDGSRFEFRLLYALKPSVPWVEKLELSSSWPRLLLVTPELSQRVLEACAERNVAAIDLNGRVWLRAPGLLVDRGPLQGRSFSYELEPRNIFVGKSARIVRGLLTDRDRIWTQAEIVRRTGASSGLVSRIIQHLIGQGFVEKTLPVSFASVLGWGCLILGRIRTDFQNESAPPSRRVSLVRLKNSPIGFKNEQRLRKCDWHSLSGVLPRRGIPMQNQQFVPRMLTVLLELWRWMDLASVQ